MNDDTNQKLSNTVEANAESVEQSAVEPESTDQTTETKEQETAQNKAPEEQTTEGDQTAGDVQPAEGDQPPAGPDDSEEAIRLPVDLPAFSGPLDLLVHLISKHELDIFSISIATITNEYLNIIKSWKEQDLEMAGEYLVLAATLVRLKARALIPKEEQEEEEEEIDDAILEARRLEYERFRQLADDLRVREEESSALIPRVGRSPEGPQDVYVYEEVNVYDLYRTFQKIIEEIGSQPPRMVEAESYSVDEKMLEIEALLQHNERIILTDYLRTLQSKLEIIVVFMALLELLRLKEIKASQDQIHAQIILVKGEKQIPDSDEDYLDEEDEDSSKQVTQHQDGNASAEENIN